MREMLVKYSPRLVMFSCAVFTFLDCLIEAGPTPARISREMTKVKSSFLANSRSLNCSIQDPLVVILEPLFGGRRENVEKLPFASGDHLNHLCNHVVWIEPPLWSPDEPIGHFLEGFALDEIHFVAKPT